MSLSVKPEDGEAVLFGKAVNELRSDVIVADDEVTGTLKYINGYVGFSSNVSEQSGNYLALKIEAEPVEAKTVVELVGGTKGSVTLDEDRNIVLLIKNKDTQSIKVTTTHNEESITKTENGQTTITASLANGVSQTCTVRCNFTAASSGSGTSSSSGSLSLNRTDFTLQRSGETFRMKVSGTSSAPSWSIGDTSVATVSSDGTVTAVGEGNTTLTCTVDGQTLTCIVRCDF